MGARTSATKSAMVKSVSCPTPLTTGTGLAAMVRASCSSLKAHRSSIEPPPRTSRMRSTAGAGSLVESASSACPSCASRYNFCSALRSSSGAPAPCTAAGASSTGMCGTRRASALSTSCSAAAPGEVTSPMPRGSAGSGRLRAGSNRPSACSRAFRRRNCSNRAPWPARCMASTTSCRSPRGSYTVRRPRTSTASPSRGTKSSNPAARRNMAQRSWPASSLSAK